MLSTIVRRRYVDWALRMTHDTELAPSPYELHLLECYVAGALMLERADFLADLARDHSLHYPASPPIGPPPL